MWRHRAEVSLPALDDNASLFVQGYLTTLQLSVGAIALSLVIGTIVASVRVWGGALLGSFARGYVEFFRNTPLLVQLLFLAVLLAPANLNVTREPFLAGLIGLGIYTGSYVSEVVRSGILSVDARQIEAARSLGLTQLQAIRFVVLPQAIRTVIPPIGNLIIAMIKNSAIIGVSLLAIGDLLHEARVVNSRTFATNEVFFWAAVGYLILTGLATLAVRRLEARYAIHR
jgi:His/Glu/Gln/Arg/opine family amino acid ABC transporter permease subunit